MTPEAKARLLIDERLQQGGWLVQDFKNINLGAGPGVAVREYPTDTGPADYVLFVKRADGFGLKFWCADRAVVERVLQAVERV